MKSSSVTPFDTMEQAPDPTTSPDRLVQDATEFLRGIEALRLSLVTKEREAFRLAQDRKAYETYLAEAMKRVNTLEAQLVAQADLSKQARSRDYERYRESVGRYQGAIEGFKKRLAGKELELADTRQLILSRTAALTEAAANLEKAQKEQIQLSGRISQVEAELHESLKHRDAMSVELCRVKEEAKTQLAWNEMQGRQLFERTHALENAKEESRRTADLQRSEVAKLVAHSKSMESELLESRQQCDSLRSALVRAQEEIKVRSSRIEAQGLQLADLSRKLERLGEDSKRVADTQRCDLDRILAGAKSQEAELCKARALHEALTTDVKRLTQENQKLRELDRYGKEIQAQANQVIALLNAELIRARSDD